MDMVQSAHKILQEADLRLRELIQAAAEAGRFEEVRMIAALAESLSKLPSSPTTYAREPVQRAEAEMADTGLQTTTTTTTQTGTRKGPNAAGGDNYPRFVRDNDVLVKVGWSSSQNSTYEHKAPWETLSTLVSRITELGENGQRFTAEALSKHTQANGTRDVPGYQLYLCLAWMKRAGLVRQYGKRWYSVPEPSTFASDVTQHWHATPVRS